MTDEIKVYDESYPTRRLLELIGDKWTPIIVYILGQGTKRYGELRRHLPDVSKKMLTQTLRALERDGLLKRKVYAEVPPRVDYDLTPLGRPGEDTTGPSIFTAIQQDLLDCPWSRKPGWIRPIGASVGQNAVRIVPESQSVSQLGVERTAHLGEVNPVATELESVGAVRPTEVIA